MTKFIPDDNGKLINLNNIRSIYITNRIDKNKWDIEYDGDKMCGYIQRSFSCEEHAETCLYELLKDYIIG